MTDDKTRRGGQDRNRGGDPRMDRHQVIAAMLLGATLSVLLLEGVEAVGRPVADQPIERSPVTEPARDATRPPVDAFEQRQLVERRAQA